MLFVWGEGGGAAAAESALLEPQVCPLTTRAEQEGEAPQEGRGLHACSSRGWAGCQDVGARPAPG